MPGRYPMNCESSKERTHQYIVLCCDKEFCNKDPNLHLDSPKRGT